MISLLFFSQISDPTLSHIPIFSFRSGWHEAISICRRSPSIDFHRWILFSLFFFFFVIISSDWTLIYKSLWASSNSGYFLPSLSFFSPSFRSPARLRCCFRRCLPFGMRQGSRLMIRLICFTIVNLFGLFLLLKIAILSDSWRPNQREGLLQRMEIQGRI